MNHTPARPSLRLAPLPSLAVLLVLFGLGLWGGGALERSLDLLAWNRAVANLVPIAAAVIALAVIGLLPVLRRGAGFGRGLALGWYLPVVGLIFFTLTASTLISQGGAFSAPPAQALGAILAEFGTGTFEELFIRAGVLGVLLAGLVRPGKMTARGAVVLSAVIFGLAHAWTIFQQPEELVAIGVQVIYTVFLGILLGAVYVRTGSIWAPIVLHALFNCGSTIGAMFDPQWVQNLSATAAGAPSLGAVLLTLVLMAPAAVIGLVLLRRGRPVQA